MPGYFLSGGYHWILRGDSNSRDGNLSGGNLVCRKPSVLMVGGVGNLTTLPPS